MKAVVLAGVGDLRVMDVPDAKLVDPGDAVVRVTTTAICGADLFPFHGYTPGFENGTTLGHEFVGIVQTGPLSGRPRLRRPPGSDRWRRPRPRRGLRRRRWGIHGVRPSLR